MTALAPRVMPAAIGRARIRVGILAGIRAGIVVGILAAGVAGGCATRSRAQPTTLASGAAAAPATAPPRLLVTIVVDQLAAWIAAERWPALPADGGFARLRREGLYVRELRYDHAVTDTAPGHSALYTGAVPRVSGIIGNEIIRPDGTAVSLLDDPKTRLVVVGGGAATQKTSGSLAVLTVDTLADVLSRQDGDAAIFSFSLKDRGALFGAGRRPTLALWFEPAEETFVTSTAFRATIPAWVTPIAGRDAVRAARAVPWAPLDSAWVAAHSTTPDNQAGEGDYAGLGRIFPHPIPSAKAMRATPAGDELLFALARGALAQGTPAGHPTLLALSLSSNDYIGHIFGPDSWEAWDELRRLDQKLGAFLRFLDGAVGPDGYAVMLTGDHGIGALPELAGAARDAACRRADDPPRGAETECPPGQRLLQSEIAAALEGAWQTAFDGGAGTRTEGPAEGRTEGPTERPTDAWPRPASSPASSPASLPPSNAPSDAASAAPWVAGIADPLVFLTARGRALGATDRVRLVQAAALALRDRYGVDDVVDIRAATRPCPPTSDQSRAALVCRSLRPDGPADLYLVVKPRTFFDARYTPGYGVHHGSPYLYDRAVPLLVRAPGRVAAGTVRDAPVSFTAFARTAASLLGVPPPAAARDGEDLAAAHRR